MGPRAQQVVEPRVWGFDPALLGQTFGQAADENHRSQRDDERHYS